MALTDKLTAIADAIRGKTGKSDTMTLAQMPGEIAGIQTGADPVLTELTITENGEYTPGNGVDGFSKVVANVAANENINTLFWTGEIELNNATVAGLSIPIDDLTCDRYIVDAWIIETGTIVDGEVTIDDKPTLPAGSNRWARAFGLTEPYYNGEKVAAINVLMGTTEANYEISSSGGVAMRSGPSNDHIANNGITVKDNDIALQPATNRYFCTSGYYAKFRYAVTGIKGVLNELFLG